MKGPAFSGDYTGLILSRRIVRLVSQLGFVIVAGVLLVIAGYRLTSLWLVPEVSVSFARSDGEFGAILSALARIADSATLKITVRELPDQAAVDSSLASKAADFAVVRPALGFPADAMVAASLQQNTLALLTFDSVKNGGKSIERVDQLAGRRIAAVGMDAGSRETLRRVLDFDQVKDFEIAEAPADAAQLRSLVSSKQIDALAISGHLLLLRRLVAQLGDLKPALLPLPSSDLAQAVPGLGSTTIAARSLPGGLPPEEVQTASTSVLLVARRDVDRATVNTFLEALFSHRAVLARDSEVAWQMKGPEDDTTFARLPNHRGALDYYNREQQTFMDLYGDWIWLGLFAAGGFSSAGAWLTQTLSRRRKQLVENILDRLLEILGEARDANEVETLDRLTIEVDGLVTHAIRQARWRATAPVTTSALTLAIDSSRAAIADRRRALIASAATTPSAARRAFP